MVAIYFSIIPACIYIIDVIEVEKGRVVLPCFAKAVLLAMVCSCVVYTLLRFLQSTRARRHNDDGKNLVTLCLCIVY